MAKTYKDLQNEIKVKGSEIVDKVKDLIAEGKTKKVSVLKDEKVIFELPFNLGVTGAMATIWMAPALAALGAVAALMTDVTLVIDRIDDKNSDESDYIAVDDDEASL